MVDVNEDGGCNVLSVSHTQNHRSAEKNVQTNLGRQEPQSPPSLRNTNGNQTLDVYGRIMAGISVERRGEHFVAAIQDVIYCCFTFNDWNGWG